MGNTTGELMAISVNGSLSSQSTFHRLLITHEVRGLISDDEICVRDVKNNATCMLQISNTEHTQKVIEGGFNMYITSCAPIDSNVIVCGKGDGLHG